MHERVKRVPDIFRERSKKERYELTAANGEVVGTVRVEYEPISDTNFGIDLNYNVEAFKDPSNILRLKRLEIESVEGNVVDIFSLIEADTSKVLIINDYKKNECSR